MKEDISFVDVIEIFISFFHGKFEAFSFFYLLCFEVFDDWWWLCEHEIV